MSESMIDDVKILTTNNKPSQSLLNFAYFFSVFMFTGFCFWTLWKIAETTFKLALGLCKCKLGSDNELNLRSNFILAVSYTVKSFD